MALPDNCNLNARALEYIPRSFFLVLPDNQDTFLGLGEISVKRTALEKLVEPSLEVGNCVGAGSVISIPNLFGERFEFFQQRNEGDSIHRHRQRTTLRSPFP